VLGDVDLAIKGVVVLLSSPQDDLEAVHTLAITALGGARSDQGIAIVQISKAGAGIGATTEQLHFKAAGEAGSRASGATYNIIRLGPVLAPSAYGGSLLLRMLAAVPLVQPIALGSAQVQTVAMADLARAVVHCVEGHVAPGTSFDLVEEQPRTLREVTGAIRLWPGRWASLGFGFDVFAHLYRFGDADPDPAVCAHGLPGNDRRQPDLPDLG
jgi:uncharacterized protein YbjT (DUF2867 family)